MKLWTDLPVFRLSSNFWQAPNVFASKRKHWRETPFPIPVSGISNMAYASCERSLGQSIQVHWMVCTNQLNQRQLLTADLCQRCTMMISTSTINLTESEKKNRTKNEKRKEKNTNDINLSVMAWNRLNESKCGIEKRKDTQMTIM